MMKLEILLDMMSSMSLWVSKFISFELGKINDLEDQLRNKSVSVSPSEETSEEEEEELDEVVDIMPNNENQKDQE